MIESYLYGMAPIINIFFRLLIVLANYNSSSCLARFCMNCSKAFSLAAGRL